MKLNMSIGRLKPIALNLLLLIALYFLSRILFYFSNHHVFSAASSSDVLNAFFIGSRFDLATICILNILYVLFCLLPFEFVFRHRYQSFLKILFFILNFPLFCAQIVDTDYYKFTGARMTASIMTMGQDVKNQAGQLILNYWALASVFILFTVVSWFLYRRFDSVRSGEGRSHSRTSRWRFAAAFALCIVVLFSGARGSFGSKAISPSYAFAETEGQLGVLALNTPFTILKSHSKDHLPKLTFFRDQQTVLANILKPEFTYESGAKAPQNVVIIILESFATEFWGAANDGNGYTPFLDSLAKDGLFFRNSFANGRRSIEALPSLLLGLPSLMEHPLAKSKFQFNKWNGLGTAVSAHGYSTAFFQGSPKGSMHFDSIANLAGFKEYFSMAEYPTDKDYDGFWGTFDEPYLKYFGQTLSKMQAPFVASVFTLSSHQPYTIPPQYKGKFRKGPTPLHESVGYTDYSLQQFFKSIENEPWFKNTLFIFTGDHTQMSPSVDYATTLGTHMVPILFYHPSLKLSADTSKIVQHADIYPSILDFLAIRDQKNPLFGRSVFQKDSGRAMFFENGSYFLIEPGVAVDYDMHKNTTTFYKFTDPNNAQPAPEIHDERMEKELKSFIQYFNNGMNENTIYNY